MIASGFELRTAAANARSALRTLGEFIDFSDEDRAALERVDAQLGSIIDDAMHFDTRFAPRDAAEIVEAGGKSAVLGG